MKFKNKFKNFTRYVAFISFEKLYKVKECENELDCDSSSESEDELTYQNNYQMRQTNYGLIASKHFNCHYNL